jgi:hypothetical protein
MTYKRTRDYEKEYKDFHSKPEQVKNRMGRNRANYAMKKAGKIKKGGNKDVHHKDGNPRNNTPSNLKIVASGKNRSNNKKRSGRRKA